MKYACAHILFLLAILPELPVHGQLDLGLDSVRYLAFAQSVKQFSEFVDRFNRDNYEVPDMDTTSSLILDRRQLILYLFNRNDPRFDPQSSEYSKAYIELALRFADEMVNKEIYLDKHSDRIQAIVTTSVLYRGDPNTMKIILTQEIEPPNMVRWVIYGVDAEFLKIPERDSIQLHFLSPVSNELGFMELNKVFREPEKMVDYTRKDFEYDRLSVLLHDMRTGSLQVNDITALIYRIEFDKYTALICNSLYAGKLESWSICDLEELEQ